MKRERRKWGENGRKMRREKRKRIEKQKGKERKEGNKRKKRIRREKMKEKEKEGKGKEGFPGFRVVDVWTPKSLSFDKIQEVGHFPTWFIFTLKAL